MKRLTAVVNKAGSDELAKSLVWLSCVDVDVNPVISDELLEKNDMAEEERRIEDRLSECASAIDLLSGRGTVSKRGFLSPKPELPRGDIDAEKLLTAEKTVKDSCEIKERLSELAADRAVIAAELESLLPWRGYDIPLIYEGTGLTEIVLGSLPSGTDVESFSAEITEKLAAEMLYSNVIDGVTYVSLIVHKDNERELMRALSAWGFVKSPVTRYKTTAETAGQRLEEKIMEIDEETLELYKKADELAAKIGDVELYSDFERIRQSYAEAKSRMANTDYTSIVTGWVPLDREDEVAKALEKAGAAYELTEPKEDDDVPVLLKNNKFAESFESVVGLYSLPKYGSYDPTMVMSIFYIIIFGLMFADVGYGLILSAACLWGLHLLKPRGSLKKFLRMFAICGGASIVMGVLFGGYFGDLPTKMAVNMFGAEKEADLSLWFNPISDPMMFLVVSIAIGVIHLVGALAVKFYILCKNGKVLDAFFDAGSWILVFLGAGVAVIGVVTESVLSTIGLILVIVGYAVLVATQGREEKTIVMKIAKGLMALYDTISYVSDLLSYSRILSLGLASSVIASVFNLIGTMGGLSFAGIIIFVIAILVGHTLNIAINVLGTFVHASRLQYIEFFGKFYEDGGRAFVPLEPLAKYHVYEEKL